MDSEMNYFYLPDKMKRQKNVSGFFFNCLVKRDEADCRRGETLLIVNVQDI